LSEILRLITSKSARWGVSCWENSSLLPNQSPIPTHELSVAVMRILPLGNTDFDVMVFLLPNSPDGAISQCFTLLLPVGFLRKGIEMRTRVRLPGDCCFPTSNSSIASGMQKRSRIRIVATSSFYTSALCYGIPEKRMQKINSVGLFLGLVLLLSLSKFSFKPLEQDRPLPF
jgi:hypothetical protein